MTLRAQRLADALGEAHRQANPSEPEEVPSAADIEAAGVEALRQALHGRQPATTTTEEKQP